MIGTFSFFVISDWTGGGGGGYHEVVETLEPYLIQKKTCFNFLRLQAMGTQKFWAWELRHLLKL